METRVEMETEEWTERYYNSADGNKVMSRNGKIHRNFSCIELMIFLEIIFCLNGKWKAESECK